MSEASVVEEEPTAAERQLTREEAYVYLKNALARLDKDTVVMISSAVSSHEEDCLWDARRALLDAQECMSFATRASVVRQEQDQ